MYYFWFNKIDEFTIYLENISKLFATFNARIRIMLVVFSCRNALTIYNVYVFHSFLLSIYTVSTGPERVSSYTQNQGDNARRG